MFSAIDRGIEKLAQKIKERGAGLVVLDTWARVSKIKDIKDYELTYLMGELSALARQTDCHIILISHIPRGRDDENDDVETMSFGSVAIAGGVNTRFVISKKKKTNVRTLRTSSGKGAGFLPLDGERTLKMDPVTHEVTLGDVFDWKEKAKAAEPAILDFLDKRTERYWKAEEIATETGTAKNTITTAANSLFGKQEIKRSGKGVRNDPYYYAGPLCQEAEPEDATPKERTRRDRGGVKGQHGLGGILNSTKPRTGDDPG